MSSSSESPITDLQPPQVKGQRSQIKTKDQDQEQRLRPKALMSLARTPRPKDVDAINVVCA